MLLAGLAAAAAQTSDDAERPPLSFDADHVSIVRSGQVGALYLPSGTGPFPAVIVMHGCDGVAPHMRAWALRLASWGYAAFIIDSFRPRGIANVCNNFSLLPPALRARDAAAGAAYLRSLPAVDGARIGAIGFSHGASSALRLAPRGARADPENSFKALVAFYPGCGKRAPPLAVDALILIGDADDWTAAKTCIDLVARYPDEADHRPTLKVYPGATHSFDARGEERIYFGHRLAYDPAAADDAIAATRQFLDAHLRP